ncbi:glycosyltransferase [Flavobacterium branchiophilum]|uniref:Glycosyl transferase, group 1 family protein n=1 Tax=Flavobacterium branchiophilum (strain FL-15) TaxID=1034807 RepID=G2Z2U3_FLABF|nr:glycosyltransferase [Flavobacterium branchiophilum]CCB70272.1 Glycosyl transferase, group 1 family protein [Flavobacterium branchiophilum FL-15]
MKTILATCYAINPYKGSEDGMGWNFICQIARYQKVIAITRANNQPAIDTFMLENPNPNYQNISFLYFDRPYWMRFWKKGSRGAMLYYYMWQYGIINFINKKNLNYDIVHNVNFHNDWTPSFLWKLNKPFVWGPIGHHSKIPNQYLLKYKFTYKIKEYATWFIKQVFWNVSLNLKTSISKANHIFCMNSSSSKVLNLPSNIFSIMPSVATEDFYKDNLINENFNIISVGRFVPLKGFDLTINAFNDFVRSISKDQLSNCSLTLIGSGPEKATLEKMVKSYELTDYVQIIEWIDRVKLMKLYEKSAIFLFPSHEGAGMVVAEALSFGLPVVCLDNDGPGELISNQCGFKIPMTTYQGTVNGLSNAIQQLYLDTSLRNQMSKAARAHYLDNLTWDKKGDILQQTYQNIC